MWNFYIRKLVKITSVEIDTSLIDDNSFTYEDRFCFYRILNLFIVNKHAKMRSDSTANMQAAKPVNEERKCSLSGVE